MKIMNVLKTLLSLGLVLLYLFASFSTSISQVKASDDLFYCTFFGGSQNDAIRDIKLDSQGNLIIVGGTFSENIPTLNAFQDKYGGGELPSPGEYFSSMGDCLIAKFSSSYQLKWSTYLGGKGHEMALNAEVDSNDNIIVLGITSSPDFATTDGSTYSGKEGGDYFIAKFDPDGKILSSTFYGGDEISNIYSIGKTSQDELIIAGTTISTNFYCSENAVQKELRGKKDGFIRILGDDLRTVLFSTYYGGGGNDSITKLSVGQDGSILVSGSTNSLDFPVTENCIQSKFSGGDRDAFVAMLTPSKQLTMSTYLGGSDLDDIYGIGQTSEHVFVVGRTWSSDFPVTSNAYQHEYSKTEVDGFFTQISVLGDELIYSTFYGLKGWDSLLQVNLDNSGKAIITGFVDSGGFETIKPFQAEYMGYTELIVMIVGKEIELISYLGGYDMEHPFAQTLSNGNLYLVGKTSSTQFPVTNDAYQRNHAGGEDGFVWVFNYNAYLSGETPDTQGSDVLNPLYRLYLSYAVVFGGIALWFLYVKRSFT